MASGELPARPTTDLAAAIDVASREAVPVPIAPEAPAVSDDEPEPAPKPPPRPLSGAELLTESTRLAVGAVVATGRGLRAIVEQAVAVVDEAHDSTSDEPGADQVPSSMAAATAADLTTEPASTVPPPAPSEADAAGPPESSRPVAALRTPAEPDTVLGALPTAALGAGLHAQRQLLSVLADGRERYGPAVTWMLEAPLVSSLYERARANVFEWYRRGATDKEHGAELAVASLEEVSDEGLGYVFQHLDLNTILRGFDINPLVQNLELSDVILSSTGGLATDALDSVRSQGVTVDDIIARISNRIFRRKPEKVPDGPDGRYGVDQELPPWTTR